MLNPGLTTEDWPQGKSLKTAKSYRNTHKIHTSKLMTLGKAVKILKGVKAWTTTPKCRIIWDKKRHVRMSNEVTSLEIYDTIKT